MATFGVRVDRNYDDPIDAADEFYTEYVERENRAEADLIVYYFDLAGYEHDGWRLAAMQNLARKFAPARVNGIAGNSENAIDAVRAYLEGAPGVTGQLFTAADD